MKMESGTLVVYLCNSFCYLINEINVFLFRIEIEIPKQMKLLIQSSKFHYIKFLVANISVLSKLRKCTWPILWHCAMKRTGKIVGIYFEYLLCLFGEMFINGRNSSTLEHRGTVCKGFTQCLNECSVLNFFCSNWTKPHSSCAIWIENEHNL